MKVMAVPLALGAMMVWSGGPPLVEDPTFKQGFAIQLLALSHAAARQCALFAQDQLGLEEVLREAGVTPTRLEGSWRPVLLRAIKTVSAEFEDDRRTTCQAAWQLFGNHRDLLAGNRHTTIASAAGEIQRAVA